MGFRARLCCAALLLLSLPAVAAERDSVAGVPDSVAVDTARAHGAHAVVLRGVQAHDTVAAGYHPTKSTGTAMLLSALLPGAGQFYNQSYWKVPIVAGLGVYYISGWLENNRHYHDYRDLYAASVAADPAGNPSLLTLREFYKGQRDSFLWYFFILYVLNIVDAYVDASLFDFDVGPDLSLRLIPGHLEPPGRALPEPFLTGTALPGPFLTGPSVTFPSVTVQIRF
jgi:hypothetical protein